MEIRKTVRITDTEQKMIDFLRNRFKSSETTIFLIAIRKLYKEFAE